MNKAVFLDRDGVINSDNGHYYVYRRSDFALTPQLGESLKRLHSAGFLLIVITNQGGVARGLYSAADVELLSDFLRSQMANFGVPIAEVYSCLHHPDMGKCLCRKPSPLMVQRALARFNIDPAQSYLIGDRESDMVTAQAAGVQGILVTTNAGIGEAVNKILGKNFA